MLKKRGILVLLMCKLEVQNFLKHHFTSISTWLICEGTLCHEVEALAQECKKSQISACS